MKKRSEEELDEIANQITAEMIRSVNAKKSEDNPPGSSAKSQSGDDDEDEPADP